MQYMLLHKTQHTTIKYKLMEDKNTVQFEKKKRVIYAFFFKIII